MPVAQQDWHRKPRSQFPVWARAGRGLGLSPEALGKVPAPPLQAGAEPFSTGWRPCPHRAAGTQMQPASHTGHAGACPLPPATPLLAGGQPGLGALHPAHA